MCRTLTNHVTEECARYDPKNPAHEIPGCLRGGAVLEPPPTKFDKRVLAALDPEPDYGQPDVRPREFRDAWEIARRMHEDDVALVRRTLRGLEQFGYCWSRKWGSGQMWVATSRAQEVL